jgi:hypothetical protein
LAISQMHFRKLFLEKGWIYISLWQPPDIGPIL